MPARPLYAFGFYPADPDACRAAVQRLVAEVALAPTLIRARVGALVPHAGWVYSGKTAAHAWVALAGVRPEVVVLLGAVHRPGVARATVWNGGPWSTPLGALEVDAALGAAIVEAGSGSIVFGTAPHIGEHALEVQAPFIKELMPLASIVAIQVPADQRAPAIGRRIADAIAADPRPIVLAASSDLTHYGPRYGFAPGGGGLGGVAWGRANDDRLVDRAVAMDSVGVLEEAATHQNACGAGALAATISACRALGATAAALLHQTTSFDERPGDPSLSVGYASVLYGA